MVHAMVARCSSLLLLEASRSNGVAFIILLVGCIFSYLLFFYRNGVCKVCYQENSVYQYEHVSI